MEVRGEAVAVAALRGGEFGAGGGFGVGGLRVVAVGGLGGGVVVFEVGGVAEVDAAMGVGGVSVRLPSVIDR